MRTPSTSMFSRNPQPLLGADNLKLYLSQTVLPPMTHGSSAPFMPPEGHKAHRNRIAIQPEPYRSRFTKIVAPRTAGMFSKAVLAFVDTLPNKKLDLPNVDTETGFAFTLPAPGFDVQQTPLPRPSNLDELVHWVVALPLQTMTRAMHVAFPEAKDWDVTYVEKDEFDVGLWKTLVWRKTPPPPKPETYWIQSSDPLEKCSVVFAVQPPWIMTPQDFKSFMNCTSLPPFNVWEPDNNQPFTSAERVWGKLWDTCVRRNCQHWVLATYWGWVFGAFTKGFTAGQILDYKSYDSKEPTIMQCLVYHVASSMDLVSGFKLPQYFETLDQIDWNMDIPTPCRDLEVDFLDSGSEWDGMDDDPGISAGISNGDVLLSAWGSEQEFCAGQTTIAANSRRRIPLLPPARAADVRSWRHRLADEPPPYEREISPAASETGFSNVSVFDLAQRGGSEVPDVKVITQVGGRGYGGVLTTVVEQGPGEES